MISATCPDGYSSFQDSCYKIYSTGKTNSEARSACTQEGSHLVDIKTQAEQDYLAGILDDVNSGEVWIGLTGSGEGAPLYWTDGTPLDFDAWIPLGGGRNDGDGGTCIRMNHWFNYRWGDKSCSTDYGYVCEFECKSLICKTVETKIAR